MVRSLQQCFEVYACTDFCFFGGVQFHVPSFAYYIFSSCIDITANAKPGAFYAVQSLISLAEHKVVDNGYSIPTGVVSVRSLSFC